jgi:hypothetical protein
MLPRFAILKNDCEFALLDFLCVLKQFFIKGGGRPEGDVMYGLIKVAKVPSKKLHFKNFKEKKTLVNIIYLYSFSLLFLVFFGKEGRNNF